MAALMSLLAAVLRFVIEWFKGTPSGTETADPERVRKLEEALLNAQRADLAETDAKAAAVRDARDAAELLRDATRDDPTVN